VPRVLGPAAPVVNVAHRGASAYVAENTLAAVRRAIALDCDLIEVDVQRSRDGALVLMHDTTLARTTNAREVFPHRAPWRVSDFRHDEMLQLDAGSWRSPHFAGEGIPTLEQVVRVVQNTDAGLLLELKAAHLYPGLATDVEAALRSVDGYVGSAVTAGRLVVQSFDFAAMRELKALDPSMPVGLLGSPDRAHLPALASWADQVNPNHRVVDAAYVDELHRLGLACHTWTVNSVPAMRRALAAGVDGVITNRPDVLARLLAERGATSGRGAHIGIRRRSA